MTTVAACASYGTGAAGNSRGATAAITAEPRKALRSNAVGQGPAAASPVASRATGSRCVSPIAAVASERQTAALRNGAPASTTGAAVAAGTTGASIATVCGTAQRGVLRGARCHLPR